MAAWTFGWCRVGRSPNATPALPCDRLYRNATEGGRLRFVDVTGSAGICADGYGMGVATGDIDNDGDLDVFVANFGTNQLFENLGDGRFRDISDRSGIAADQSWSVSASFADIDGDGLADLYVANYVEFALADHKPCTDDFGQPTYCSPVVYQSSADLLYRNLGDGKFADISAASGIGQARRAGLGVVVADFDNDRDVDFYVANDMADNLLWINQGDATFKDTALLAGAAANSDGMVEAGMGIAAEDFDADGDVDLFVTHLAVQTNTLIRQRRRRLVHTTAPMSRARLEQRALIPASAPLGSMPTTTATWTCSAPTAPSPPSSARRLARSACRCGNRTSSG